MMRLVNLLQPLFHHMGIDLRGGNIGMSQHQLYRPQVGPALQQVRGEAVPQHMWRQRYAQSRFSPIRRENLPYPYPADPPAAPVNKQKGSRGAWRCPNQGRTPMAQVLLY